LTLSGLLGWLPWLLGLAAAQGPNTPQQVRRVIVGQQVILRVPVRPLPPPRFEWEEHKGPSCFPVAAIRGAMLSGPTNVDFLLPDRQRIRAEFADDCPALDFYGGFYLKPQDERVCANRDSVHSRIGGSCRIERFRRLVPKIRG
jgi:hypothetical protein